MHDPSRPNVVFVLTDDQGYGDLGCHGHPYLRTPHLDRLHGESVRFTDFHVGTTCAPTRAGLFTGHHASSAGVWHTIGGRSLLREGEWTLATAMREAGYRTGIFGKWHLGDNHPYRPHDRGFETAVVHGGGGISQTPDHWGNDYFDDVYSANGEPRRFEGYCTDVFFAEAARWIEERRDEPFLCCITTNAPHSPFNVEDEWSAPYLEDAEDRNRANFYGMIANIDDNVGRLRARLQELGLAENTIFIFMTDNGTAYGCDLDPEGFVTAGYNAGMRGKKVSPYDGGHRVPFFVHHPAGGMGGGRDVDALCGYVDFMPTILDLCGIPVPADRGFHGRSCAPLLRGEVDGWEDRALVVDTQRIPRPLKWRLSAVMTPRWRLVHGDELYDVRADPEQTVDVSAEHPEVVAQLREEYESWWTLVGEQFDRAVPIPIGGEVDEVDLCCHDWRTGDGNAPWSQGDIRRGVTVDGYWEIRVERGGEYEFACHRWPRAAGHALCAGIDGDDVEWRRDAVPESFHHHYTGGKALDLRHAVLRVGDREQHAEVPGDEPCVRFRTRLESGETRVSATFSDRRWLVVGAYYVYVRRVG